MTVRSEAQNARQDAWEYLVITGEAESPDLLAEHGAQGWELVAVVREFGTRATFYFKRRRPSAQAEPLCALTKKGAQAKPLCVIQKVGAQAGPLCA